MIYRHFSIVFLLSVTTVLARIISLICLIMTVGMIVFTNKQNAKQI